MSQYRTGIYTSLGRRLCRRLCWTASSCAGQEQIVKHCQAQKHLFSTSHTYPRIQMATKLRGRSLYRLMKIISGLSFCMYGYDAGVLGGILLHKSFQEAMGNPTGVWIYPMIVAS